MVLSADSTSNICHPGHFDRHLFTGIAWTAIWRWVAQLVSWMATFYTARILLPADYGLVAMASIPIGLVRLVEDLGLDGVIVQDRTLQELQLSQLASLAVLFGGGLSLLSVALASPLASYFHEPEVAVIISVLSFTFLLDAIQIVPRAALQRDLAFKTLAWLAALQTSISAGIMVFSAAAGLGYWSLVINTLISHAVVTVTIMILHPVRFSWPRNLDQISQSLVSGWRMLISRIAWYGYSSIDSVLIGRVLGKELLGVYGFASSFASLPPREITSLVSTVVPGVLSAVQSHQPSLRRYFLLLTEAISYITLPASLGLAITADDFVLTALGPQWEAVTMPLQILCLYSAIYTSQTLVGHILLWTGYFRANMWFNILTLLVLSLSFWIGIQFGISGIAWGWVIGFPIATAPSLVFVARLLGIPVASFFDTLRASGGACLMMLGCVFITRCFLPDDWHHPLRLGIQVGIGTVAYSSIMLTVFRPRVLGIYRTILGQNRASEPLTDPLT